MTSNSLNDLRRYSHAEASAMLPWLRQVVGDVVRLSAVIAVRRPLLEGLSKPANKSQMSWFNEEVEASKASIAADADQLRGYVAELATADIQVRSLGDGLLEIPGMRQNRSVWFSWQHGEPEIGFWREESDESSVRRRWEPSLNRLSTSPRPAIESSPSS